MEFLIEHPVLSLIFGILCGVGFPLFAVITFMVAGRAAIKTRNSLVREMSGRRGDAKPSRLPAIVFGALTGFCLIFSPIFIIHAYIGFGKMAFDYGVEKIKEPTPATAPAEGNGD